MKKNAYEAAPRIDESRPAKPAAALAGPEAPGSPDVQVPTYGGPSKTDQMPAQDERTGLPAKDAFTNGDVSAPDASRPEPSYGDQQPRSADATSAAPGGEQYIRVRVRVRDDSLSVLDSHLVDGPLGQTSTFAGSHAYEVTVGDRLLHAGALPDLGVQRSFVNPDGPREQQGHHLTERRTFEFTARVPAHEVTRESIGEMAIRLHRIKDSARTDRLGSAPLGVQFEREARQVAELVGLPDSVLPEEIEARGGRTANA